MASFKKRDVMSSLKKKGFASESSGDHIRFYLQHNGKETTIRTKVSHGTGADIDDSLVSLMAKQVKLSNGDFKRLIECPLSKESYIQMMIDNDYIDDE